LFAILLSAVLLLNIITPFALAEERPTQDVTVIVDDGSYKIDFNDNWRFYLATRTPQPVDSSDITKGLQDPPGAPTTEEIIDPDFDDSSWRILNVPHDWSIEGEKVPTASNSQGYLLGGLGWYRKTFILPESMSEKKIFVDFEGVYKNSVVYVNGNLVGIYPNGYTGFAYDITPYVNFGSDNPNVIVVKVQNLAPSGRWYTGSGITRPVSLLIKNKTRFMRHGITYTTPDLEQTYNQDGSADLVVKADILSEDTNGQCQIRTTVIDSEGNVVATKTSEMVDYNPSAKLTIVDTVHVPNVNLWSIDNPYLYTIRQELIAEPNASTEGPKVVDVVETEYGFRWFEFKKVDPENVYNSGGFYLNGEYIKLQGVDLHHDNGALGAASNLDASMRKFKKLKEMGVNAYRTSHNPPPKEDIIACERLGIVVLEEAYDGWGSQKAQYDFGRWFLKEVPEGWAGAELPPEVTTPGARYLWSDWVIQEMVNRDKNSPAVIAWSIGNEVRGVGTKPSWLDPTAMYGAPRWNEYSEAVRLVRDVKAIDDTRPIVLGGDQQRTPPQYNADPWGLINQLLDGFGLNYNTVQSVDTLMTRFPDTFFFESESASQTSTRGVYQDPQLVNTGVNQTPGKRGTSSYDNNMASWCMTNEYGIKKDRDRKGFVGQFIWSGFDYIGEPTPYFVYPVGVSFFGCIDTAGFPKDSFYIYQSQWTTEPMAHILPMNWNDWEVGEEVEVWVYTNQQSAELFLNGRSLGRKSYDVKTTLYGKQYYETTEPTKDDKLNTSGTNTGGYLSPNGSYGKLHLTWIVPYEPGVLEVKAYPTNDSEEVTATDVIVTAGQPYTIRMKPDKVVILANGRSLSYVECDIVDEDGNIVPNANNLVKFEVTGGAIVGVDNGQQESNELYKWGNVERNTYSERSAFNGKVLCIIQSNKDEVGPITLKAYFDGGVPAETVVYAIDEGETGVLGVLPVNIHVMKGEEISLPNTVTVVNADGTTTEKEVEWENIPDTNEAGQFEATAEVDGVQAVADITVYEFSDASVEIAVAIGDMPTLPNKVKVNFTNGLSKIMPVEWPEIEPSKVQRKNMFTVKGQILGLPNQATAKIYVSDDFEANINLARRAQGTGAQDTVSDISPLATASFTSGSNYPNNMLDGSIQTSWSNRYNVSATAHLPAVNNTRPKEFVEVYWPTYQTFDSIKLYFTLGGSAPSYSLPESLEVQYWDGGEWVPATNQSITWATASNQPTTITFDKVTTTRVRVRMVNATPYSTATGAMAITEFEVYGNKINSVPEDVKPFVIEAEDLDRTAGIKATARVVPTDENEGKEVVLFQLMKDTTPINIIAAEKDITSVENFIAYFNVVDYEDLAYKVKVFVFDRFDSNVSAPVSLAEPVELK